MSSVLLRERSDAIEVLRLNRPEKRNALNLELVRALHAAFDDLKQDGALRAVILASSGADFMAGADIAQLRERGVDDALASINGALFRKVEDLPVPVIAAVGGYALGGGCELALAADLRVAGHSARLGQPEVALGILPGAGATHRLPRLVGLGLAKELIFTGRIVDAAEALRIGLVNRVVDDARILETSLDLAREVAKQGPLAVRLAKLALNAQRHGLESAQTLEAVAQGILFESDDKRERMTRFLERKSRPDGKD